MTAGQFRAVDLDLLADYVGGALDGSPDEADVARLVADDPAWAEAHAALAPAVDAVRVSLADWGMSPAAMPPEVNDRLTAALARAGQADPAPEPATSDHPHRRLTVVPGDKNSAPDGRDRGADRPRRRWSRPSGRLAAIVAVAAAVAAFAGFGLSQLGGPGGATDTRTASGGNADSARSAPGQAPAQAAAPGAVLAPAGEGLLASGTDYAPATLADRILALGRRDTGTPKGASGEQSSADQPRALTAAGLDRLSDRAALATCLDAVAATHATGPLTVDLVDYASFEGSPALVVAFTDRSGARWAWVSGPDCGLAGSGADTRHRARVG